jgi:Lrp/AsnC family transcriptional regulator
MVNLDSFEIAILDQLQTDASLSIQEIASRVGLSQNPCWRRIRKLEEAGFINQHDDDWLDRFSEGVRAIPEVVEFYRMSGHVDYMLKVVVRDVAAYDGVYKRLIRLGGLSDVTSSFAM